MFDVEKTLTEYGLTIERYEELLKDCSDKVYKVSDIDWSEIASKYGIEWNGDSLRKAQQPPLLGGAFVREYYKLKNSHNNIEEKDSYAQELKSIKDEIFKVRSQPKSIPVPLVAIILESETVSLLLLAEVVVAITV